MQTKISETKSIYGPTLDHYINEYARLNGELPSISTLKNAGFKYESEHDLKECLKSKANDLRLPLLDPDNYEDNYKTKTNNYTNDFSQEFSKALDQILTKFKKKQLELLNLLSDGTPKTNDFLMAELKISKQTLYNWFKQIRKYFSIKKEVQSSEGRGRPKVYYRLDFSQHSVKFDQNILLKSDGLIGSINFSQEFSKALDQNLQNYETQKQTLNNEQNVQGVVVQSSTPKNGITPFEEWIRLPFKVPDEWKPILTLIVGTSIAGQHVQIREQLHGLTIKNAIISAYKNAVKDLMTRISDIAQVNGQHYFELCGGAPAAFFDKHKMHETLGCVGDLEGKIEEVTENVFLRKRRL